MKKVSILLFLLYALPTSAQRHYLQLSAQPAHTRVRQFDIFYNMFGISICFDGVAQLAPPVKPYYGYDFGVHYGYHINKNTSIKIGVLSSVQRSRSGNVYAVIWSTPPPNYGGQEYIVTVRGYEIPVHVAWQHFKKKKLSTYFDVGVGVHFYRNYLAESLIIEKRTGFKRLSCYMGMMTNSTIKSLQNDTPRKTRLSASIGYMFHYQLHRNVSVQAMPQFRYISNSLKESSNFGTIKADMFVTGVDFGLNLNF